MNLEDIQFANSKEGREELELMASLSWQKRYKRLKENNNSSLSYISALIEAREKASEKFSKSSQMYFDLASLSQASSERVSQIIAERFSEGSVVADLGCGIGGNLIELAKRCKKVFAIEEKEELLECARLNARAYGVEKKIIFINTDVNSFLSSSDFDKVDAIFLDPARDREGRTKTRSFINSRPDIIEILPTIFEKIDNVCVKLSPAFDYKELSLLTKEPEVEIVSEHNSCKVALLWFGGFIKSRRTASCIKNDKVFRFSGEGELDYLQLHEPLQYLFEADKAISRSGLVYELASIINLSPISNNYPYLTGNKLLTEMEIDKRLDKSVVDFFQVYEIQHVLEASFRNLKKELKKLNIDQVEIKAKGHYLKPEEIGRKLGLKEGNDYTLFFLELKDMPKALIISKRLQ